MYFTCTIYDIVLPNKYLSIYLSLGKHFIKQFIIVCPNNRIKDWRSIQYGHTAFPYSANC